MKAFFEVHLKLILTIWIILFSVLGLLYLMNYMKFNSLMSTVISSQLQVMAGSIERSIIRAEQLGLPLGEMENLPDLMQRAKNRDSQVSALYIISSQGTTLFATRGNMLNPNDTPLVLRKALKGDEPTWTLEEDGVLYTGLQLFDATQQLMGGIIITYDKTGYGGVLAQVKLHLLEVTLLIFSVFACLIFVAVRFGFGDINDVFKLISAQLPSTNESPSPPHPKLKPGTLASHFAEQLSQSNQLKAQLRKELESVTTEIGHSGLANNSISGSEPNTQEKSHG